MKKLIFIIPVVGLFFVGINIAQANVITIDVETDHIVNSGRPDNNYKCSVYGDIGSWSNYEGEIFRYLTEIDLSSAGVNSADINYAIFKIDRVSTSWDNNDDYVLHKVTGSWTADGVTWNDQPDFDAGTVAGTEEDNGRFHFDITDMVKGWLNDSATNRGILIKKRTESIDVDNNKGSFACADYSSGGAENRPVLDI